MEDIKCCTDRTNNTLSAGPVENIFSKGQKYELYVIIEMSGTFN